MAGEASEMRGAEFAPRRRQFRLALASRGATFFLAIAALPAAAVLISVFRPSSGPGTVIYRFDAGTVRTLLVSRPIRAPCMRWRANGYA